ncbi:uncharacterized protein IUM83_07857 [Phytophthora cinnamomi]|uniref:uncharacterized protein n=1 Tax=Phytophthora cinnamomi TaxID=4785 RepID=UPI0035598F88|nr:hypothetical protein IUM83_07857 [Phytophthora cinnamomi]
MTAAMETRGSFCIPARRMRPMRPVPTTARLRRLDADAKLRRRLDVIAEERDRQRDAREKSSDDMAETSRIT